MTKDSPLAKKGNAWVVASSLTDNVGDTLNVSVAYVADGGKRLDIFDQPDVRVENLGLVTTFPVVTEVAAAITKHSTSAADLTSQSTIPISWAVRSGEAAHVAVTFPWMIGINTHGLPRLADVVKVFPHVSVIFPVDSDPDTTGTRVAFGAGIALANALTLSYATTVDSDPKSFFLVGISAQDLAKIFLK